MGAEFGAKIDEVGASDGGISACLWRTQLLKVPILSIPPTRVGRVWTANQEENRTKILKYVNKI